MAAGVLADGDTAIGWIGAAFHLDAAAGAGGPALLFVPLFYKLMDDLSVFFHNRKMLKPHIGAGHEHAA